MIKRLMDYYNKYKEIIVYVFFGAITTFVYFGVFYLCEGIFLNVLKVDRTPDWALSTSTTIAWVISVLTAFITNKLFVFKSKSFSNETIRGELIPFVLARVLSLFMDQAISVVGINYMLLDKLFVKIFANVFVLIFNYIASKLFIFKKKGRERDGS